MTIFLPRSLRDEVARAERRAALSLPHIAPLAEFAASLRTQGVGDVPDFDPFDGGIGAQLLFLFEKPGPMTATGRDSRSGSGFISRDNDDPTAEATFRFMAQADICREDSVVWNAIPWWNGTRKIGRDEVRRGEIAARELVHLLPRLRVLVFVGARSAAIEPAFRAFGLPSVKSTHPSPLVRARWPERWLAIPTQWSLARQFVDHRQDEALSQR